MNNINSNNSDLTESFKAKARYFLENKIPVHAKYKANYFKNGTIIDCKNDYFRLQDFLEGELVVFYTELERLEEYRILRKSIEGSK